MSERIWVICDKCGEANPSGISVAPEALDSLKLSNNTTVCKCGHEILWSKAEVWPESVLKKHKGRKP